MSNLGALRQMLKEGSEKHLFKQTKQHDKEFGIFFVSLLNTRDKLHKEQ